MRQRMICLLLTVLLIGACTPSRHPSMARVRFTEVIHSIFYLPQYIAQSKGFVTAEGIE